MMAKELQDVDWKELADWLNLNTHAIEAKCRPPNCEAALVSAYCDWVPTGDSYRVAADIAKVLEDDMKKLRQAETLRQLTFSTTSESMSTVKAEPYMYVIAYPRRCMYY